jgi:hypothetical protein
VATSKKFKIGEPVTAYGFKGMNNLPEAAAKLLDRERQITPQIVLNADVTDGGVVRVRGGYKLTKALTNCHSVAGEESGLSVMLCVADGIAWPQALYRVEGAVATELCEVTGPPAQVNYAEINNVIYASNPYWKASYDLLTGTVGSWGISLPPAPSVALVAGDLPPGTYSLCYTNVVGNRLGGNGPLVKIRWEGGQQGIQLKNLPSGALCWITQPNGKELFLAPVSGGVVSAQSPYMSPLPSFMVQPPPGFAHFIYAFGRIWGARGKQVFYSDPNQYEWFRVANFLPFLEDVVLLAPTTGGIFVNSLENTWFLDGTDPAKMQSRRTGNGAVPGTLTMVQVPANIAGGAATNDLFAQLSKMPTPVWMSPTGFVVGTHGGNLTYLTENRLNMQPRTMGASLYRFTNGIPQVISSLRGLPGKEDSLEEFFTRGQIYIPAPVEIVGSVEIAIN